MLIINQSGLERARKTFTANFQSANLIKNQRHHLLMSAAPVNVDVSRELRCAARQQLISVPFWIKLRDQWNSSVRVIQIVS